MKKFKSIMIAIVTVIVLIALLSVCVFADEAVEETKETSGGLINLLRTCKGGNLALLGAFLAMFFCCWGSAKGVGLAGKTAAGIVAEDPSLSGKLTILEALPATQGIYGFATAFMVIFKIGAFGGFDNISSVSTAKGYYILIACLIMAFTGFVSALHQAKVAAAGMQMVTKQKDKLAMAITYAALVETYAILALVISLITIILC